MKASHSPVALHIANLGGQIGMSGLECGGCQPQAVLGWRSQCVSASSTGLCVSGQAGLHGNVLQSCCLLVAFCWSKCEADGAETTNHPLLLGPAPPVHCSALCSTHSFVSTLWRNRGHHSSEGQAMTRETGMSPTAHCWHLYCWCFWLMATSLEHW